MRRPGFAAPGLLIIAILLLVGMAGVAPAAAVRTPAPPRGRPRPRRSRPRPRRSRRPRPPRTPAPPRPQTDVVTLVLWYQNPRTRTSSSSSRSRPTPVSSRARDRARQRSERSISPRKGSPTIVVGDTTFETYPRPDGVIERWTWLDDFEGARPATLVMQLAGLDGTYQNYFGTATLVSRDEGGAGGVLTIALRPPSPAAAAKRLRREPAAADAPAAEDATAGAAEPEATVEPGTEILIEPAIEGEAPGPRAKRRSNRSRRLAEGTQREWRPVPIRDGRCPFCETSRYALRDSVQKS